MKKQWMVSVCLLWGACVQAEPLREAVLMGVSKAPEMQSAIHGKLSAEQEVRGAYAGYFPSLDFSADHGTETSSNVTTDALGKKRLTLQRTDASLVATQSLFNGFGTKYEVDRSLYKARAAAYDVEGTAQDTALGIVQAYLQALAERKKLVLAEDNLKEHQLILSRIEKRAKSGIGRVADLDQAQGRFALARTDYMTQQANVRDADTRYLRLVGALPKDLQMPTLGDNWLPKTQESAVSLALSENAHLRSSISNVLVASSAYKGAYSSLLPAVDFQWTESRANNVAGSESQSKIESGLFRVNYNVFRGGADKARVRKNAEELESAKASREVTRKDIEQKVRLSWNAFYTSREQLKFFQDRADATERTREAYRKQFAVGQRTLLDLLDSENEYFHARTDLVTADIRQLSSQYELLAHMNRLFQGLGLEPPEEAAFEDPGLLGTLSDALH